MSCVCAKITITYVRIDSAALSCTYQQYPRIQFHIHQILTLIHDSIYLECNRW